jgi:hypothetical protein
MPPSQPSYSTNFKAQYAASIRSRVPQLTMVRPPSKRVKGLSMDPKHQVQLDKFKDHLLTLFPKGVDPQQAQEFCDDATLVRYLRSRGWNIKKAGKALQETLVWRAAYHPQQIRAQDVATEAASGANFINGFDKYGRPIMYIVKRDDTPDDINRSIQLLVYNLELASKLMAPGVNQLCLIVDFRVYAALYPPTFKFLKKALDIIGRHYPDMLGECFFMNPPPSFTAKWKLFGGLLDKAVKRRVTFLNLKEEHLRTYEKNPLINFIDQDQLLDRYGGSCPYIFDLQLYTETAGSVRPKLNSREA